ncbi:maf-like protein [Peptoanaerobacter stomatis]|uniref:dTTP/UTP pyrophosphatase n=1 Tax=Peptoanaerobacter stomatis TaxID=796937 RepID=G9XE46_9FIRM|nr:Maf family protein [Peptoanaerobacter stomatis]EHL18704.1 maf-like protein [Peptoanaerobacter stomatis]
MKLILSSSSPRRQEIMDMFDIEYIVDTTDVERTLVLTSTPHINAMVSAFMKAASVYEKNIDEEDDIVVLGADTTVTIGDYQFGKPKDDDDQFSMLKYLSGKTHDVITGYAIIKKDYKYVDYVVSKVKFKELSEETIKNYIKTEEGGDKAGSYALQGIGSIFIDSINGDYQNIIGLPISKIYDVLKTKFSLDLLDFEKFENQ